MLRKSLAILAVSAVAGLAGCASTSESGSSGAIQEQLAPTQLAAFSAKAAYPATQPMQSFASAAIVSKDKGTIKIYNFTDKPVGDSKVWVNHSYVYHIFGIAPQSKVVVNIKDLYDSLGNSFAAQKDDVSTVQLQTDHGFYNIEGPAME